MSREDQRLMLVGSALTGLMAQHTAGAIKDDFHAAHYTDDELADAAMKAVKVADLALTAIGCHIPTKYDVYEMIGECWALLEDFVKDDGKGWFGTKASELLRKQKGQSQ